LSPEVIVLGAGPAGLTAAYELKRLGIRCILLEASGVVGGISQTVEYKGFLFDIGGHRFFTKVGAVEEMWREVLGSDLLSRPRQSRILYRGCYYDYPLRLDNVVSNLGVWESFRCLLSYLRARAIPQRPENDFETWIVNRFGQRLYEKFFKSYTEKVWGIPCKEIRAEWAAQRIKGLSLTSAVWNAIRPQHSLPKHRIVKTLIHEFLYPRHGPGMMWQRTRDLLHSYGSPTILHAPVSEVKWSPEGGIASVVAGGTEYAGRHFLSSLPIRDLIRMLNPQAPELNGVPERFNYRDFLTVALIVRKSHLFSDNWIYIHDPSVKVGRIQNFKNWSPEMVPDPSMSCLGLEYFCFEGDGLWNMADSDLIALARAEAAKLGLVAESEVVDGTVVRMPKAYPVYDSLYKGGLDAVRGFLSKVPNLQLIGRNGMHHYNNQDHSMLTGMLAAQNIAGENRDVWSANVEADYHEEIRDTEARTLAATQPQVPSRLL
jgi:protoporphyrinogen oxidase